MLSTRVETLNWEEDKYALIISFTVEYQSHYEVYLSYENEGLLVSRLAESKEAAKKLALIDLKQKNSNSIPLN